MSFTGKLSQDKRGVGSIVGAVFIALILMSGFAFYILYVNINESYRSVTEAMDQIDLRRKQENIEFVSMSAASGNKLNITIKNSGSYQVHLIWLGIFDETVAPNTQKYCELDVYINPTEVVANVPNETVTILTGQERVIQLATELGNIFTSTYPFEEGVTQTTVTITGKNCTVPYNPLQWNLLGSTTHISGSVSDLAQDDGNYAVFRSYYTGTRVDINDFVDNICDLYPPPAKGTHSNFAAQQYGPDSVYDTLTEANTGSISNTTLINGESFEGTWPPSGWTETSYWGKSNTQAYAGTYSARFDSPDGGSSGDLTTPDLDSLGAAAIYVDFWYRDEGCESNEFLLQYYDGTSWDIIYDLGATTSQGQWLHYQQKVTDSQYFKSNFKIRWHAQTNYYNDDAYVDLVTVKKEVDDTNYELDLEVQWTNADHDETNEELCIKTGVFSGSENLQVKVRSGGSWVWVMNLTANQWNNMSVTSYLTGNTFTIQFLGGAETNDKTQNSWNIDVSLLHVWTMDDRYIAEVEFIGSSNLEAWLRLLWQIDSRWDTSQVIVTIQFFNFTLGNYTTSGNGYMSYVSSVIPNTDELKSQTITSGPTSFRDATGYWKVKITGYKVTSTPFLMKVDWVDFETSYSSSGSSIRYNEWQWYTIKAATADGGIVPYAYVSIYANGTYVSLRNATDQILIPNPAWVRLNAIGEYQLDLKSEKLFSEVFVLYAVFGDVVGKKTITQEAP